MKKLALISLCVIFSALFGCKNSNKADYLTFATSAEYPPYEYKVNGELHGFDIDLAKLIAQEMGKKAQFEDMQFSTILPALQNGYVDAAIATITITDDRKKHVDFSQMYYFDGIAAVFNHNMPIKTTTDLSQKKISCQLGSTMEIWLKKNGYEKNMVTLNNNNQAIEALKAGHIDVVLMDAAQGNTFSKKNSQLSYQIIEQSEDGYAIALPKNSNLLIAVNQAIENLKQKGEIHKLEQKWLKGTPP